MLPLTTFGPKQSNPPATDRSSPTRDSRTATQQTLLTTTTRHEQAQHTRTRPLTAPRPPIGALSRSAHIRPSAQPRLLQRVDPSIVTSHSAHTFTHSPPS